MGAPGHSSDEEPEAEKTTKKNIGKKKKKSVSRTLSAGAGYNESASRTLSAGAGSDAWNPAPPMNEQPGPAAAARGPLQAPPAFQQGPDPSFSLALQAIQAQLERILLRQEQMLAGSFNAGSPAAPSASSPRPAPERKAVGPELQVQLERLAAAQEDMKRSLSKLATGAKPTADHQRSAHFADEGQDDRPSVQPKALKGATRSTQFHEESHGDDLEKASSFRAMGSEIQEVARASAMKRAEIERMAEQAEVDELKQVFEIAELHEVKTAESKSRRVVHRVRNMSSHDKSNLIDLFIGTVICLNMVVIGISMDSDTTPLTLGVDSCLSCCFIWEMLIKIKLHGLSGHFCPPSMTEKVMIWNDTLIVIIDLSQLIIEFLTYGEEEKEGSEMRTSLLRIFRLCRLTRIIRILRLEAFHDLITMVTGLAVGMPVLMWSVVLLFITLYVVALFGRLGLGAGGPIEVRQEFETVMAALFATFRCSFGDCTTRSGTTLLGLIIYSYGPFVGSICCLIIFFVTIGIFNVISAIFVEGTLSARMAAAEEKKKEKLNDEKRFSTNMKRLMERVCELADVDNPCFSLDKVDEWAKLEITTADFKDACIHDEEVRNSLRELEINEGDLPVLADILDPQNDLVLTLVEILHGIKRLRGDPRRSDIVNVDLMLRDVQESVGKVMDRLGNLMIKLS